jgi:hypothetical protein
VTVVLFAASYCSAVLVKTEMPRFADLSGAWRSAGGLLRFHAGADILVLVFLGLWTGAASHTFTDLAGTYIKTGRSGGFL